MKEMAKQGRSLGPQTLATEAQYLLTERRQKRWIPFLEAKIAALQARIQDKAATAGQE